MIKTLREIADTPLVVNTMQSSALSDTEQLLNKPGQKEDVSDHSSRRI